MAAKTILFIDDDVKRITSHVEMLELEGYKVEMEQSVKQGLQKFTDNPTKYDLIILDIMMPVDDFKREDTKYGRETGILLIHKIRDISEKIPIIILSVLEGHRIMDKAKGLGVDEYLLKPQLPSAIVNLVNSYLK